MEKTVSQNLEHLDYWVNIQQEARNRNLVIKTMILARGSQTKLKNDQFLNLMTYAFQRRFRQELINGKIDHECLIISQNLVKKFN